MMSEFWRDTRFGLRLLSRSPVFTITASLLLGVGIGANTLIFSVVDKLLLRPLPVKDAAHLVRLIEIHPTNFVTWDLPLTLFEELEKHKDNHSLVDPLCQGELDVSFEMDGSSERVRANAVSRNYFDSLGMMPQIGRVLTPEDDSSGALVAVLSYNFWQRRFAGSNSVVGSNIKLTGRTFTIVGVLPRGANGVTVDTSPDIRVPIAAGKLLVQKAGIDAGNPMFFRFQIFGRLRPGVKPQAAEAELEPLLRAAYEDAMIKGVPELAKNPRSEIYDSRLRFEPADQGISTLRSQFSHGLGLLMACVGLLLLMACANVAGLLLARSAARTQEVSIRLVLGANTWRVLRQLLTESLVLGMLGGVIGILFTYASMPLLLSAIPPIRDRSAEMLPLTVDVQVDPRVLAFAFFASILTAVLFGLSPALQSARANLGTVVRGSRTTTARLGARNILVIAQVAVCVLLLVGAGLLVETFDRMRNMNAGFDRDHVATFTVDPGLEGYSGERARTLSMQFIERTRALPGVVSAAVSGRGLMRGSGMKGTYGSAGAKLTRADFLNCSLNTVTPEYFSTLGMRVLQGRDFSWSDDPKVTPSRLIVNEAFVRRFFPGQDPLGKLIGGRGPNNIAKAEGQIIGVVSDAKYRSLREPTHPIVYSRSGENLDFGFILNVRTHGRPESLIEPVREVLRSLDPQLPLIEVRTLREEVELSLWQERLLARLSALFGCFAAALAAIGLYGALDFVVKARTREIGVRVALGANPGQVVRMLSLETFLMVGAGVMLGLAGYAASARWIRQVLFGVSPTDATPIAIALLFVVAVSILAVAPPIWRAIRIDPATALRYE